MLKFSVLIPLPLHVHLVNIDEWGKTGSYKLSVTSGILLICKRLLPEAYYN